MPRGRQPSDQNRLDKRNAEIILLKRKGFSFREISEQMKITPSRAHEIYWRELRRDAAERHEQADIALTEVLEREELVVKEAAAMMLTLCTHCANGNRQACTHCKGSGYQYGPTSRLGAMAVIQRADETFARLFGLEKKRIELTVNRDMLSEVESMSPEQLLREIEEWLPEVDAAARMMLPPGKRSK